jgi:predicted nucleic acid-binding protein/antitoxin (DNA-binding transcriptional repressor) of toxin-antitoxin stability system
MYHMTKASVRDLRYEFKKIERLLLKGEEIQITKRRRMIARLVRKAGRREEEDARFPGASAQDLRRQGAGRQRRRPDIFGSEPVLRIYADSSFLVSLYSADTNWPAAARTMETSTGECLLSTVGEFEVVNAFGLRVFRKEVSAAQAQASLLDFEKDLRAGILQLRELSDPIFQRARQLSRQTTAKLGTRTADLLHVAAALELGADFLYSFDQQQRGLARSLRLKLN